MQQKKTYIPPLVEVIEMEYENSVMVGSGDQLPGLGNGGTITRSSVSRRNYQPGGASLSELEDLINNILTIEK
ncbi:hypothetical protein [Bacteroides sp. 224]|uniref:hypothetical protein n=1 Tax=Bacteroides sp. 224 TaxID=2302936 RepID=UPI0013D3F6F0|nr:hypothetical protein [Bacteroides sp. 224]NDV67003.1 hypothetical protein [Bacteroides sp. 224]